MFGERRSAGAGDMDLARVWETLATAPNGYIVWLTADGAPVTAAITPAFVGGKLYLVSYKRRAKTVRLQKDSRCVVMLPSPAGYVTLRGRATVSDDAELMFMWAKAVGERGMPLDPEGQRVYLRHTVSPDRWPITLESADFRAVDEDAFLDLPAEA